MNDLLCVAPVTGYQRSPVTLGPESADSAHVAKSSGVSLQSGHTRLK